MSQMLAKCHGSTAMVPSKEKQIWSLMPPLNILFIYQIARTIKKKKKKSQHSSFFPYQWKKITFFFKPGLSLIKHVSNDTFFSWQRCNITLKVRKSSSSFFFKKLNSDDIWPWSERVNIQLSCSALLIHYISHKLAYNERSKYQL